MDLTFRFVRIAEATQRLARSRSSLYRDVAAGRLPKPIKIGPRAVAWPSAIFESYIEKLAAATDGPEARGGGR